MFIWFCESLNFKHEWFPFRGIWAEHNFLTFFSHPNPVLLSKVSLNNEQICVLTLFSQIVRAFRKYYWDIAEWRKVQNLSFLLLTSNFSLDPSHWICRDHWLEIRDSLNRWLEEVWTIAITVGSIFIYLIDKVFWRNGPLAWCPFVRIWLQNGSRGAYLWLRWCWQNFLHCLCSKKLIIVSCYASIRICFLLVVY